MRVQGTVVKWLADKDFGFIAPGDGSTEIFVHAEFFVHQGRRPQVGDSLFFEIATNAEGKRRAERVLFAGEHDPRLRDRLLDILCSLFAVAFLGTVGAAVFVKKLHPVFLFLSLGASLLSFLLYWRDKVKANRGAWRIAEKTLHLCSLVGGWPGALLAQRLLHHKSRKRSFQLVFIATVLINSAVLVSSGLLGADYFRTERIVPLVRQFSHPAPTAPASTASNHTKTAIYSWINKDGKRVYSNVGFPTDQPYRDGQIEWQ